MPVSIYRYIYHNKKQELYKLLTRQNPKRYPRGTRKSYQKELILQRNICNRPKEVNLREILGHWEGDTIRFSKTQKSCVTTLVERKTRFLLLHKNENQKSQSIIKKIYNRIHSSPKKLWCSLTLDQGIEFMPFRLIERKTKCKIYFCDPRSPWQRASNENTNGRIRRFLPRKLNIDMTSQEDLDRIEMQINGTPRKCLGYQTPKKALIQHFRDFCRTGL